MPNNTIHFMNTEYNVLKMHRNKIIAECPKGIISIIDPVNGTNFIVGLDDSKMSGHRTFDDSFNSVAAAVEYIESGIKSATDPMTSIDSLWYSNGGTIRTKANHMIARFIGSVWLIDPDAAIPKHTVLVFTHALHGSSARFNPNGTQLILDAQAIQSELF